MSVRRATHRRTSSNCAWEWPLTRQGEPKCQYSRACASLRVRWESYRVANNGISSGITVDLSNLQDLANKPADLVEALNQALFRGEMDSNVRGLLITAASGSTSMASRVRSALYAAGAAPQYQVKR